MQRAYFQVKSEIHVKLPLVKQLESFLSQFRRNVEVIYCRWISGDFLLEENELY